jgi:pilus assembly protein CpaB
MDVKKLALLAGALVIAITTALLARSLFAASTPPAQQIAAEPVVPKGPKILVATRALPVGTILTTDSMRFQPWPSELIQNAYFKEGSGTDMASLAGRVVRAALTAGQPITQGALVKPGERGFLAAALSPGMRAMTVPVSAETGVAGFVFPGDRVDIVLTQTIQANGTDVKASETIVRNLRVLAADQRTSQLDDKGQTNPQLSQTVTLEVTPKIGEKIAVAQSLGNLSLLLRSLSDGGAEVDMAIASGRLSLPANLNAKAEQQRLADIAGQPNDRDTTYSTGADVSRFLRSNLGRTTASRAPAPPTATPTAAPTAAPARPRGPNVRIWREDGPQETSFAGANP